jgi:predicted MPP superfamily phosphohydrolase
MRFSVLPDLALVLLTIPGHLLLVRETLSLVYRFSLPWFPWLAVNGLLLASCVVIPWVLVVRVGLHGARVLRGGHWWRVPAGWQVYVAACVGAVVLTALLRLRRRDDAALVCERGRTSDVARELGTIPAAPGVRRAIARLPGNAIFRVEINRREIVLPGMAPQLDGLSILHLSDLHFNGTPGRAFFERALELAGPLKADLIALTGDILDRHARADWLPTTLAKLAAPLGRYFVLGNHDALDEPENIRAAMRDIGWTDVGARAIVREARGIPVVIAGSERPWLGIQPVRPETGAPGPAGLGLLLSHTPAQFACARAQRYDLVLAGHLHGGQINFPLFGSVTGGRYHGGVFSAGPTVMHVSRGLGVMFPMRLNCPAEITKLVLRAPSVT